MPRERDEQSTRRQDDRRGTDLPMERPHERTLDADEEKRAAREEESGGAPAREASDDQDWAGGDREI